MGLFLQPVFGQANDTCPAALPWDRSSQTGSRCYNAQNRPIHSVKWNRSLQNMNTNEEKTRNKVYIFYIMNNCYLTYSFHIFLNCSNQFNENLHTFCIFKKGEYHYTSYLWFEHSILVECNEEPLPSYFLCEPFSSK